MILRHLDHLFRHACRKIFLIDDGFKVRLDQHAPIERGEGLSELERIDEHSHPSRRPAACKTKSDSGLSQLQHSVSGALRQHLFLREKRPINIGNDHSDRAWWTLIDRIHASSPSLLFPFLSSQTGACSGYCAWWLRKRSRRMKTRGACHVVGFVRKQLTALSRRGEATPHTFLAPDRSDDPDGLTIRKKKSRPARCPNPFNRLSYRPSPYPGHGDFLLPSPRTDSGSL